VIGLSPTPLRLGVLALVGGRASIPGALIGSRLTGALPSPS
jgi:hypothetical protein